MKWNWLFVSGCQWLAPVSAGKGREGIVRLYAKFGQVHQCAWWFILKHNCASVEQEGCGER